MNSNLDRSSSRQNTLVPFPIYGRESTTAKDVYNDLSGPFPTDANILRRKFRNLRSTEFESTSSSSSAKSFESDQTSIAFAEGGLKRTKFEAYSVRISELRHISEKDGYSLNPASELDFWLFVGQNICLCKGNLVLMDNGNLRTVWKDNHGNRVGLQFLGGGIIQYVIFKRREFEKPISRATGRDTFAGLRTIIKAFDLHSMLYE